MKVLLQNRVTSSGSLAGDVVQMEKTDQYLQQLGVEVRIDCTTEPDLKGVDLVHLFNLIPVADTYRQFLNARRAGVKIVLSTIFWDVGEYLLNCPEGKNYETWWQDTEKLRQEILAGVDLILPNSYLELEALRKNYQSLPPAVIVPNAADKLFASGTSARFERRFGIKDYLLSVGRISPRKNQLALIAAVRRLRIPLVIVGPLNDGAYYQECRRAASGLKCLFIDALNENELASAYAGARVHALVSWYETPGLASLEAALAGCKIVSTDRGSAREYFQDRAYYCQPDDEKQIVRSIAAAWQGTSNTDLQRHVLQNYTWEQTAAITYAAYRRLLTAN